MRIKNMSSLSFILGLFLVTQMGCTKKSDPPEAHQKPISSTKEKGGVMPVVVIKVKQGAKELGEIEVELNEEKAPISVKNFLAYVDNGHYNGVVFHRVIKDFMIQGGGMKPDMSEKSPAFPPIQNEAHNGLKNERGTLAMARTSDVNSATAQFFINTKDNTFLDHKVRDYGYAVFGKVVKGMDVVDQINGLPTGNKGMHQNVPLTPIEIVSVEKK